MVVWLAAAGIASLAGPVFGARFDPLFRVVGIRGECTVKPPGSDEFVPATENKAYQYGTEVRTGAESAAIVRFSNGNDCRLEQNTCITVLQDERDEKLKIVKLHEGKIMMELDPGFSKRKTDALNIDMTMGIVEAMGGKFNVAKTTDKRKGLSMTAIACTEGTISVFGPGFEVPVVKKREALLVSGSPSGNYACVRSVRGEHDVDLAAADGARKTVLMKKGFAVKFWRTKSKAEGLQVTAVSVVTERGAILDAYAYEEKLDKDTK